MYAVSCMTCYMIIENKYKVTIDLEGEKRFSLENPGLNARQSRQLQLQKYVFLSTFKGLNVKNRNHFCSVQDLLSHNS